MKSLSWLDSSKFCITTKILHAQKISVTILASVCSYSTLYRRNYARRCTVHNRISTYNGIPKVRLYRSGH